ncbi:MAG TPA: hypothetical protein VGM52_07385 [Herbaspirillum sp.]|jgi:hypothetical protein
MKLSRPSRLIAALTVLISMVFMQLAIAGYACPTFKVAPSDDSMSMSMESSGDQAMSSCMGSDKLQPSLCHAQDQNSNQSLDKPATPHVSPFLPASLTLIVRNVKPVDISSDQQPDTLLLARSTAPPLSISNCCFRI